MKRITVEMLEACNACEDQVDEFARRFPDGVTFGSEADAIAQCVAVSDVFDWDWAADSLLTIPAREAYEAEVAPAWEAYKAAKATAWEAYKAATAPEWEAYKAASAPEWEAYEAASAPEWEAYEAVAAPEWEAYEAASAPEWEAYEAAKATAFASAFYNQEG